MRKVMVLLCMMCFVFGVADVVRAQLPASEPAISIGEVHEPRPITIGDEWMIGFQFSPTSNMIVTDLGFFSPDGDFEIDHVVSIFDYQGNFLTGATVTGEGSNDFVYTSSDSLSLISGNLYYILGENNSTGYVLDLPLYSGGWSSNGISSLQDQYLWGYYTSGASIDIDDLNTNSINFICGPNFKFTAVPVPGAIWLLGSGLIGLVGVRRLRGKA